jgi:hypothetical protein
VHFSVLGTLRMLARSFTAFPVLDDFLLPPFLLLIDLFDWTVHSFVTYVFVFCLFSSLLFCSFICLHTCLCVCLLLPMPIYMYTCICLFFCLCLFVNVAFLFSLRWTGKVHLSSKRLVTLSHLFNHHLRQSFHF